MPACSVPDCAKPVKARGWCQTHYDRWKRRGDPLAERGCAANGEPLKYFNEVVLSYEGDDCLTWPFACAAGYGKLRRDGQLHIVSRLVCEEFHGPAPTPEHHAAHSCGKGHEGCVARAHLSWKSPKENNSDKLIHGTLIRGAQCWMAKLTEIDIREIRALKGAMLQREIASRFGIHPSTVSEIHNRKKWAWVDQEEAV
jgi:hypothetical protein